MYKCASFADEQDIFLSTQITDCIQNLPMEDDRIKNRKGFTLAELLIVVAIISVLVGISIPVFNNKMEKVREAADLAQIRSYYAEISVAFITGDLSNGKSITLSDGSTAYCHEANFVTPYTVYVDVVATRHNMKQKINMWQTTPRPVIGGIPIEDPYVENGHKCALVFTFPTNSSGDFYLKRISFEF